MLGRQHGQVVHGGDDKADRRFGGVDGQACVTLRQAGRVARTTMSATVGVAPLSEKSEQIAEGGLSRVQTAPAGRVGRGRPLHSVSPLPHQCGEVIGLPPLLPQTVEGATQLWPGDVDRRLGERPKVADR